MFIRLFIRLFIRACLSAAVYKAVVLNDRVVETQLRVIRGVKLCVAALLQQIVHVSRLHISPPFPPPFLLLQPLSASDHLIQLPSVVLVQFRFRLLFPSFHDNLNSPALPISPS